MNEDAIVKEVHKVREAMLAEFKGDMDALVADLQRRTEESRRAGRRVISRPPRQPKTYAQAKKVG